VISGKSIGAAEATVADFTPAASRASRAQPFKKTLTLNPVVARQAGIEAHQQYVIGTESHTTPEFARKHSIHEGSDGEQDE
jgi:hypothetical protein